MKGAFFYKGKPYSFTDIKPKLSNVKRRLPLMLGNEATNFFRDSFRRQGWKDRFTEMWRARNPKYAQRNQGRAILMNTGRLRNSIRLIKYSFALTEIGTDVPYAAAHNWGFKGRVNVPKHQRRSRDGSYHEVQAHSRQMNMPRRQFMGNSDSLEKELERIIESEIDKIFKI